MSSLGIKRPDWDEYFIDIAWAVSKRSTCSTRKVGGLLVDPLTHSIKTTAYNGAGRGAEHCPIHSEPGMEECVAIHCETNLITNAALNGISTAGSWLYLTATPCIKCAPMILNAGIYRIVCDDEYRLSAGVDYLRLEGVKVRIFEEERRAAKNYLLPLISPKLDNWYWDTDKKEWGQVE